MTIWLVTSTVLHGGVGDWDEYALLVLAPVVIAAVLWVTRSRDGDSTDEQETDPPWDER